MKIRTLKRLLSIPPRLILEKSKVKLFNRFRFKEIFQQDLNNPTYSKNYKSQGELLSYFPAAESNLVNQLKTKSLQLQELSNLYLDHYFDLLGSGWRQVKYGMKAYGVEGNIYDMSPEVHLDKEGKWLQDRINQHNLKESQRIWRLIDTDYQPIDWQLDFKSGYRWSEKSWYKNIQFGHKPGIDVKVPWELARMQHLPTLAWAFGLATKNQAEFKSAEIYLKEFENQILDFIATNPPRFGANWSCTMDVGIRVSNWLVAFDLFSSFGAEFSANFLAIFQRSIYEHGKHCLENLEYSPEFRSNHYCSDIAGLFFAAAYLPKSKETDSWLAFAVQELISEMEHEFHPDGSNFEASTSYHRLSLEMMLYCSLICLKLPPQKKEGLKTYNHKQHNFLPRLKKSAQQKFNLESPFIFPKWYLERLEKAFEFTENITKPSGEIHQVGDNDSGRFLKLWPEFSRKNLKQMTSKYENLKDYNENLNQDHYLDENLLDHSYLRQIKETVFQQVKQEKEPVISTPERELINNLLEKKYKMPSYHQSEKPINRYQKVPQENIKHWEQKLEKKFGKPCSKEIIFSSKLTEKIEIKPYPDFGLYIFRSPEIYCAIRCGSLGQTGIGGHAHNDQLAIELNIKGNDILRDPGTGLYTASPDLRNQFRSVKFHTGPRLKTNVEPGNLKVDLFRLEETVPAEMVYFVKDGFIGAYDAFGFRIERLIKIKEDRFIISDYSSNRELLSTDYINPPPLYSKGYGWIETMNN